MLRTSGSGWTASGLAGVGLAVLGGTPAALAQTTLHANGPYVTGPTTMSGLQAPAGALWSELSREQGTLTSNVHLGFNALPSAGLAYRVADDFVVPAGGWQITRLKIPVFQTTTSAVPTVAIATIRIFDGRPDLAPNLVFGDETTNRMAGATFTNVYRCYNSLTPFACGAGSPPAVTTNRRVADLLIEIDAAFPPGTYWWEVALTGSVNGGVFVVPTTIYNRREASPGANARQRSGGSWIMLADTGAGCQPPDVNQETAFEIIGTPLGGGGGCYANCDSSTATPVLNVADFTCFLQRFAAGASYANCDASTAAPVLNVADFTCFLQRFAAGCP